MSSSSKKAAERRAKAAEMRAAQARREARRRILTIGGVVLAMALIVGGAVWLSTLKQHHDQSKLEAAFGRLGDSRYELTVGPDSAPKHVVIYEDFLCPVCGYLEANSHEKLAQLASQGKVQVTYRPFDLLGSDRNQDYSGRAAAAFSVVLDKSGAGVAKKFHDLLYSRQPDEGSGPFYTDGQLASMAAQAGARGADVRTAILAGDGRSWAEAATKEAGGIKIPGTPTVFVDGHQLDPTSSIQQLTNDLIAQVS